VISLRFTVVLESNSERLLDNFPIIKLFPCLFFSTNYFTVTESNILNIRLTFHINTKNRHKEQLNVACIVHSNEKHKCTAASFRMGRPIGTLHIKDKIFLNFISTKHITYLQLSTFVLSNKRSFTV
jgi:hypothetical protein